MRHIGEHGVVRPRDIEAIGLPREYLVRLHRQLNRPGRGIYTLPDANVTEHHSYPEVAKRVPEAVVCPLSALAFHEITTQSPPSVWIALHKGARKTCPRFCFPQDRSAARTLADRGNRKSSDRGRSGPRLFSREDRRRLFQVSEQNRTRCRDRSPKRLSSPEKGQH
jgi:hypothetical protein